MSKLCAMFKIGPDVETSIQFDLILYENAIQFNMERCLTIEWLRRENGFDILEFEKDLHLRLKMLHALRIMHKDIKPENILYSWRFRCYVFCDFGIAEYIKEDIGETSSTIYSGTPGFFGPEMEKLGQCLKGESLEVDLYYNDLYGWKETFKIFEGLEGMQKDGRCLNNELIKKYRLLKEDSSMIRRRREQKFKEAYGRPSKSEPSSSDKISEESSSV